MVLNILVEVAFSKFIPALFSLLASTRILWL